jgi:hypothetical protein
MQHVFRRKDSFEMEYFKYLFYFIVGHILLTFVYRAFIYYLYKRYDIRFKRQSAFFSLTRNEIKENIVAVQEDSEVHRGLQRLLVLHTISSITGKIIMSMLVLVIVMIMIVKIK